MSFHVLGIGEILWDLLETGPQLGGAPANFAYHAGTLGATAGVVSRVGNDSLGNAIQEKFAEMRLPLELLQVDASAATGTAAIELTGDGVPEFTIRPDVAWDYLAPTESALAAARRADAVCFGTLAQRREPSRGTIRKLLRAASSSKWRVFDVNLRQNFYTREIIETSLQLANVLKLNESELNQLSALFHLSGAVNARMQAIADRFALKLVALTRGPRGSVLYAGGRWSEFQPPPVRVNDTVGAGDAFTAALVTGLLQGMDLDQVNHAACEVARHLCSCPGAMPLLPQKLRDLFSENSGRNGSFGETKSAVSLK
jgi:fructokinase